jgi:tetratricopeptide (TPR) repeat protein
MTNTGAFLFILLLYVLPFQVLQEIAAGGRTLPQTETTREDKGAQLNALISRIRQQMKISGKTDADTLHQMLSVAYHFAKENDLNIPYQLEWLKAEIALQNGNYYLAGATMEKVIKVLETSEDQKEMVRAVNLYTKILFRQGEFSKAISLSQTNMKRAKDLGMTNIFLESMNRLADLYKTAGDTRESKQYYFILLDDAAAEKDTFWMTEALFRLGEITGKADGNLIEARRFFSACLKLAEQVADTNRICWVLNHLAWNLYLQDKKDSALILYRELISLATRFRQKILVANALGNIGTIYRDKKEFLKAEKFYSKSIEAANEIRSLTNLQWIHLDASDMYKSLGDYEKAYYHYVQYKLCNDSLKKAGFDTGLAEARMKYEVDQQQKELEVLSLKLSQQKWFTYASAALVILIILVGLLLIRQFRLSARRRISEMNRKIAEITQANLRQQMNPHFIFNTLNSIQYYMYQHDKVATNTYLTKFSSLIRKILDNSRHTSIPVADELEALHLYLELEKLRFKDKFTYQIELDQEIDTLQYRIPTMLIQPYVENAICHGLVNKEGPGHVHISFAMETGFISCIIEDNGIGREAAREINRQKSSNHNSLGTRITQSRLDLVNTLYGTSLKVTCTDLKDTTGQPGGTRVEIHIPIMA